MRIVVDLSVALCVLAAIALIVVLALAGPNGSIWAIGMLSPFVLMVAVVALERFRANADVTGANAPEIGARVVDVRDGVAGVSNEALTHRVAKVVAAHEDPFVEQVSGYLTGMTVLVTGASGSVGASLCQRIAPYLPRELVMMDNDVDRLFEASRAVDTVGGRSNPRIVVGDIRDQARVDEVFREVRPNVVFHAAGLSLSSELLGSPSEAWNTNVLGSNNVLRASASNGVTQFVNLSYQTAADPSTALGYTESVVERLTTWYANRSRGQWVSARFGHVLESSDEMVATLREQLRLGGPLEVSHPEKTRHVVAVDEASRLIIHAGAIGARGEVLVLDVGDRVRVVDIANDLMEAAGKSADIIFTGLREGEDLHEALVARTEIEVRRAHPEISHVLVPALSPTKLGLFDPSTTSSSVESLRLLSES